jgi:hypothetical protein
MPKITRDRWVLWRQFWTGAKAQRVNTYYSEAEGITALEQCNTSPSAEWNVYTLEFKTAPDTRAVPVEVLIRAESALNAIASTDPIEHGDDGLHCFHCGADYSEALSFAGKQPIKHCGTCGWVAARAAIAQLREYTK